MVSSPLFPVSIVRSKMILETKKEKSLVSISFIADFGKGISKVLNTKRWVDSRLIREIDNLETPLSKDTCVLYHLDWSENPVLGTWENNYPKSLSISNS